jgi:DNA-binding transcriptional regulator YdaS (Cro superfamily)
LATLTFQDKGLDWHKDFCLNDRMSKDAITRAVAVAGGQTKLAKLIGVTQGHVSSWIKRGKVPAEKVLLIERQTGVPRYDLRPDVFGGNAA